MPKNSNTDPKTQCVQTDVSVSAFLNGKAKQDFIKWYDKNYISVEKFLKDYDPEQLFKSLHEPFKPTLIVEWLDSIGINITIGIDVNNSANSCEDGCENCDSCYDTWNPEYEYCIYIFTEIENNLNDYSTSFSENNFQSRKDALENSIQKANELYNAKVVEAEH